MISSQQQKDSQSTCLFSSAKKETANYSRLGGKNHSVERDTSYMSTKPSKFMNNGGGLHNSNQDSHSNNNMRSWLNNFETQRQWIHQQSILENSEVGVISSPRLSNLFDVAITASAIGRKRSKIAIKVGGHGRQNEQLLSEGKQKEILNPKTSQGNRAMLNRSIGYNQDPAIELILQANGQQKALAAGVNQNVTFDSKLLPSLQINCYPSDREKQLLQQKNRQITTDQINRIKSKQSHRRSISVMNPDEQNLEQPLKQMDFLYSDQQVPPILSETHKKQLLKNMQQTALDIRVVEQWLNDTLFEAEEFKIHGALKKQDIKQQMNAISRYGIDRMTLTNSGIPNDEVNHLYRSLFVYSVGFFNLIKDIVDLSKEVCLGQHNIQNTKHMTKFSITTAIWKVFQILLEYTFRADYKLLITKIQEDHEIVLEAQQIKFQEKQQEYQAEMFKLEEKIGQLQKEMEQMTRERTLERNLRIRLEDELKKNAKTHEDEVSLRLRFEEKLNNLHALNRITNQNLVNAEESKENQIKLVQEVQSLNRSLQLELDEEKIKSISFEQKCLYSQERINVLITELSDSKRHAERLQQELTHSVKEYEKMSQNYQEVVIEKTTERMRAENLSDELSVLRNSHAYFKSGFENYKEQSVTLQQRVEQLVDQNQKLHTELGFYKQESSGENATRMVKADRIKELQEENFEKMKQIRELEENLADLRSRYAIAQDELGVIKQDYQASVLKLEIINKARHDAEINMNEKIKQNNILESRLSDRDETINRNMRKIHELDEKVTDYEHQIMFLEKDRTQSRIDIDLMKRTFIDKLQTLEELVKNEKDLRFQWSERFERESRQLSQTTIELMDMKGKCAEFQNKIQHYEVELKNERDLIQTLIQTKKELMATVNTYIVRCETQESDLNAMKEVNKHFEQMKEIEFKGLKEQIVQINVFVNQQEMNIQDLWSRCAWYSDKICKQKSSILRVGLELTLNKRLIVELKDRFKDKMIYLEELEDKLRKLEDELILTKNSYIIAKEKNIMKDEQIYTLQKQLLESKERADRILKKKKALKKVNAEISGELQKIKNARESMENKIIQVVMSTVDEDIQCQFIGSNLNSQFPSIANQITKESGQFKPSITSAAIDRNELAKIGKTAKKEAVRQLILGATKAQGNLAKQYELRDGGDAIRPSLKNENPRISKQSSFSSSSNGEFISSKLLSRKRSVENTLDDQVQPTPKDQQAQSPKDQIKPNSRVSTSFQRENERQSKIDRKYMQIQKEIGNDQVLEYGESENSSTVGISRNPLHKLQQYTEEDLYTSGGGEVNDIQVMVQRNEQDNSNTKKATKTKLQMSADKELRFSSRDPQRQIKNLLRNAFHERK